MRRVSEGRKSHESPVSVRLDESLFTAIRKEAERSGKPVSAVIRELLEISIRMSRFPGITFVEGPFGRRAHLIGTGLDVWEIMRLLREFGSESALREHFPRLSTVALKVAQAYAKAYPVEIDAFIEANSQSLDELRRKLPWLEVVHP
jgi:uncharacterized protein (DUF433 family)